jgi:hypothetical protein
MEFCDSLQSNLKHHLPVEEKPTQLMLFWGRRGVLRVTEEGDMEGKDGRNERTMLHGDERIARILGARCEINHSRSRLLGSGACPGLSSD